MFLQIICKILGIDFKEDGSEITISLERMKKKHPKLVKQVLTNFAKEMSKDGFEVIVANGADGNRNPS